MNKRHANPHTQHGRRTIYNNAKNYKTTPKEKEAANTIAFLMVGILFVVILLFLLIIGGTDAIRNWLIPKGIK